MVDAIRDSAGLDGGRHQGFIIVYRPDNRVGRLSDKRVVVNPPVRTHTHACVSSLALALEWVPH